MELVEVISSNIKRIGYDEKKLIVEYKSGAKYFYKNVPRNLYKKLLESESKGRFMNSEIKGHYEYEKFEEKEEA